MTSEQIMNIIVSIFPSVVAILTMLGTVLGIVHKFTALKKEVTDMKCIKELNEKMSDVLQENYELKKTLKETMTKIDHVRRD